MKNKILKRRSSGSGVRETNKKTKGTLARHSSVQLGQIGFKPLVNQNVNSNSNPSRFQNLVDAVARNESEMMPSTSTAIDFDTDVTEDENDFIHSQDFFCAPDYIIPEATPLPSNLAYPKMSRRGSASNPRSQYISNPSERQLKRYHDNMTIMAERRVASGREVELRSPEVRSAFLKIGISVFLDLSGKYQVDYIRQFYALFKYSDEKQIIHFVLGEKIYTIPVRLFAKIMKIPNDGEKFWTHGTRDLAVIAAYIHPSEFIRAVITPEYDAGTIQKLTPTHLADPFYQWNAVIYANVLPRHGERDHVSPMACFILDCLRTNRRFNMAHVMLKHMEDVVGTVRHCPYGLHLNLLFQFFGRPKGVELKAMGPLNDTSLRRRTAALAQHHKWQRTDNSGPPGTQGGDDQHQPPQSQEHPYQLPSQSQQPPQSQEHPSQSPPQSQQPPQSQERPSQSPPQSQQPPQSQERPLQSPPQPHQSQHMDEDLPFSQQIDMPVWAHTLYQRFGTDLSMLGDRMNERLDKQEEQIGTIRKQVGTIRNQVSAMYQHMFSPPPPPPHPYPPMDD